MDGLMPCTSSVLGSALRFGMLAVPFEVQTCNSSSSPSSTCWKIWALLFGIRGNHLASPLLGRLFVRRFRCSLHLPLAPRALLPQQLQHLPIPMTDLLHPRLTNLCALPRDPRFYIIWSPSPAAMRCATSRALGRRLPVPNLFLRRAPDGAGTSR
jgi:hypothetical protein